MTSTAPSKLGLVKTAHAVDVNHDGVIDAGDRIDWTLVATNLGQTTITQPTMSDPSAGPVTCPTTTLAPGASVTCTVASHTITAADVTAGQVTNTARRIREGQPETVSITSAPAHATVDIHATPDPGPGPGAAVHRVHPGDAAQDRRHGVGAWRAVDVRRHRPPPLNLAPDSA